MSHYMSILLSCSRCDGPFAPGESMACTGQDEYWHIDCFVCARCFKSFQNQEYYEFQGRKYCERDFRALFAPCCSGCDNYIIGRYIKALNKSWHPNCFLCNMCSTPLADQGFVKNQNLALCHSCNLLKKGSNRKQHICFSCKTYIEDDKDGKALRYKDETYHAYHFNCSQCGIQLRSNARQVNNDLYCLKCHDQREDIPICGACRRPIDDERVVTALGKHWHCEHFVCSSCERPFLGKRHYEIKGLAYCETDYRRLFGHVCYACEQIIEGSVVSALGQFYCANHFACYNCHVQLLAGKSKFFDIESKPCCKKCYRNLPGHLRKRLAKQQKLNKKLAAISAKEKGLG